MSDGLQPQNGPALESVPSVDFVKHPEDMAQKDQKRTKGPPNDQRTSKGNEKDHDRTPIGPR